jgi:hypothetical protein
MADQRWTLDVAVRYRRNLPRLTPRGSSSPLFDLCDLLRQPLARMSIASPSVLASGGAAIGLLPGTMGEVELRYGEEAALPELSIDPV